MCCTIYMKAEASGSVTASKAVEVGATEPCRKHRFEPTWVQNQIHVSKGCKC
jgi:hypothetical protein